MTAAPFGGRRVPMTLLGGYLGAGKTTIVNGLLAAATERIVVLVNDIGVVNVDASLIGAADGQTIELTNGCVCCSLVDGFAVALERVRALEPAPDHVLVELSGVAEPARVRSWASTAGFCSGGVLVVADADQIRRRAIDDRLADLVAAQIGAADIVLLTKRDLVGDDGAEVSEWLRARTKAPIVAVDHGGVDPAIVLGWVNSQTPRRPDGGAPEVSTVAGTDHVVATVRLDVSDADPEALLTVVAALPPDVVRVKGLITTSDGVRLIERVGTRTSDRLVDADASDSLILIALSRDALDDARRQLAALPVAPERANGGPADHFSQEQD